MYNKLMPNLLNSFRQCRMDYNAEDVNARLEKHDIWYPDCSVEGKITYLRERQLLELFQNYKTHP